jgi:hypothetical protein
VWKSTTEVGCAAINCGYTYQTKGDEDGNLGSRDGTARAQGWYVVCEYTPAGNVVGEDDKYFRKNVVPKSRASNQPSGGAMNSGSDFSLRMTLLALGSVAVGMGLYT